MKNNNVLKAEKREESGRSMRPLANKRIPAVVYGGGKEAQSIWVDELGFSKAFAQAGKNSVLELTVGQDKKLNVLIHDYQTESVSGNIMHIDFLEIKMDEIVEAEIPLVFEGVAGAVKEKGGTLVKNFNTVMVKALPANLPHEITVDLSKLVDFDDNITVADITVESDVELLIDKEATLASVTPPRSEEEMESLNDEVDADVSKVEGAAEDEPAESEKEEGKEEKKD
jgi:large subunit ribosomal protein L25